MTSARLTEALRTIGDRLRLLNRHIALAHLQTGIAARKVSEELRTIGLQANGELEALYGWRNGTSLGDASLGDLALFPGFYLLSLEDAVANYRAFVSDPRWSPDWLPFLANGGGDFYIIDLASGTGQPIRHFWIDDTTHPVEFSSLALLFETFAAAFERGLVFLNHLDFLDLDDRAFIDLAIEMDPGVCYWKSLS
ncbi:SMI1/KNR4 family protein [Microbacterium chocolatum]|uniref:SMI1/KNR4 family protein n=1 Tax=Microbacterium aurantiacum TaxID=162393 RepID=UPI00338D4A6E